MVFEILNGWMRVVTLKVNFEKKKILVLRSYQQNISRLDSLEILKQGKILARKVPDFKKYKIVFSLDSELATTVYGLVSLIRLRPKEIIDGADFENLVSQAIWRFFDRWRSRAAEKMNSNDVDIFLQDVDINSIKIDNHKILNPIGFNAKTVEFCLGQNLINKNTKDNLEEIFPNGKIVLTREMGISLAHITSKILKAKPFLLINIFGDSTTVTVFYQNHFYFLDKINWGFNSLVGRIRSEFSVDEKTAKLMLDAYSENNFSKKSFKKMGDILIEEFGILLRRLDVLSPDNSMEVYVNSFYLLPNLLYSERLRSRSKKQLKLSLLSTNLFTEKLGYDVQFKRVADNINFLSILAPILDINFMSKNDYLNHLANRRVRWLSK